MDRPPRGIRGGGLSLIRYLVATSRYRLSEKAYELLSQGFFELEDLERAIECGTVYKTEKDELKNSVGNKKYIIIGHDTSGYLFYTCGKILKLDGEQEYFVITAHGEDANYD
jgi:hypothetical protein